MFRARRLSAGGCTRCVALSRDRARTTVPEQPDGCAVTRKTRQLPRLHTGLLRALNLCLRLGSAFRLLLRSRFLQQSQVAPHLLHDAVLELPAARGRLRLVERSLCVFGPAGREIGEAEVLERRRRRRSFARAAQTVDGAVELLALVVDPSERRERKGLQLLRSGRERAAGVVERGVEVVPGLSEVRRELVIPDGARRRRVVAVQELADDLRRLRGSSLGAQRFGEDGARGRRDDLFRLAREHLPAGEDGLLPEPEGS